MTAFQIGCVFAAGLFVVAMAVATTLAEDERRAVHGRAFRLRVTQGPAGWTWTAVFLILLLLTMVALCLSAVFGW